jgi:hypothetical protein
LLKQDFEFVDARRLPAARLQIGEEMLTHLFDGLRPGFARDPFDFQPAGVTLSYAPITNIERFPNPLTADFPIDPDRAVAFGLLSAGERAALFVSPEEDKTPETYIILGTYRSPGVTDGSGTRIKIDDLVVPGEGVEPTRPCGHRILSPARLPIPPLRRSMLELILPVSTADANTESDRPRPVRSC